MMIQTNVRETRLSIQSVSLYFTYVNVGIIPFDAIACMQTIYECDAPTTSYSLEYNFENAKKKHIKLCLVLPVTAFSPNDYFLVVVRYVLCSQLSYVAAHFLHFIHT